MAPKLLWKIKHDDLIECEYRFRRKLVPFIVARVNGREEEGRGEYRVLPCMRQSF